MFPTRLLVWPADWFNVPVINTLPTAPTPGTFDWEAASWFGRIHAPVARRIEAVHLHLEDAHTVGDMVLELWRNRGQTFGTGSGPGTMTKIADLSVAAGEANGSSFGFTFVSEAARQQALGDYLHLQATDEPGGGSNWRGFVDVHYTPLDFWPK